MILVKKEYLKVHKWKIGQNAPTFHQRLCQTNLFSADNLGKDMQKIF